MIGQLFTLADVKEPVVRALRLTQNDDIALAVRRIDLWHRELCSLGPWPILREETTGAGTITMSDGLGVYGVAVTSTDEPVWYVERTECSKGDLAGRRVWTTNGAASNGAASGASIKTWQWSTSGSGKHIAETSGCTVFYWKVPETLSEDESKISIPSIRALMVCSICDLIGLMDRKEVDAMPWRQELRPSIDELMDMLPKSDGGIMRLLSGRVLMRAPAVNRPIMEQKARQQAQPTQGE